MYFKGGGIGGGGGLVDLMVVVDSWMCVCFDRVFWVRKDDDDREKWCDFGYFRKSEAKRS